MPAARRVVTVAVIATMLPAVALTQTPHQYRQFKDSWFWGVKGGVISFSTSTVENEVEPVVGIEWLLTRTQGALYLALDQSLFDATSSLQDTLEQTHTVVIRDMRRATAAALAFPLTFDSPVGVFRPYAGVGFALNFIRSATATALPADSAQRRDVRERLKDQRDRAAPLLILGLQLQVSRLAAFAQATAMPAEARFLLNGRPTLFAEVGLRVNAGRSRTTY
jgi:hypothetical protein